MSSLDIIHRDLACRNILVGHNKVMKIADFGLARNMSHEEYISSKKAKLPLCWMSPEAVIRGLYTEYSDV